MSIHYSEDWNSEKMTNDLLSRVNETINKYGMLNKEHHILVGLSGGADSVTLLLCLKKLGYDVFACHVNHHLRGEESDRDEKFCRDLCESLGIELIVKNVYVKEFCERNSLSDEEGARILRYQALESIESDRICTAHNLNDCLETTLFNLTRGAGLKGISSIPMVRGKIVRPLLECSRDDIENFLLNERQEYVTDSTNFEIEFSRNRIRNLIIPELLKINPSLYKTFKKTITYLRKDNEFIEKIVNDEFDNLKINDGYDCIKLISLDYSIRRRAIKKILEENSVEISSKKIAEIESLAINGGKVNIKNNLYVKSDGKIIKFIAYDNSKKNTEKYIIIKPNGSYSFGKRKITFFIESYDNKFENVHKKFANQCLDYDKIKGEIVLRNRLTGDKIQLVNRNFNSDMRKLINKAFLLEERDDVVILADDEGPVFLEKFGASERVKIDGSTKNILAFKII